MAENHHRNQPTDTAAEQIARHFIIHERDDLSIAQLHEIEHAGHPVLRTLHIGNAALYNGLLISEGFRVAALDRTIPDRDGNYNPGHHIEDRRSQRIIDDGDGHRLVTHVKTRHGHSHQPRNVVDVHMEGLHTAFPQGKIETFSDYLRANEAKLRMVDETLMCLSGLGFGEWNRRVEDDGTIHEVASHPADSIGRHGIFRNASGNNEHTGMLTPNSINILLCAILDAAEYKTDQVYHLSGPDMIVYLRGMAADLDAMYAAVRAGTSFGRQLPEQLHFHIVPTSYNRFAVPSDHRHEVEALFGAYDSLQQALSRQQQQRRAIAQSGLHDDEKHAAFAGLDAERNMLKDAVGELVETCPWLFDSTASRAYYTQYDVARARNAHPETSGIYVPERVRTASFAELRTLVLELGKIAAHKAKQGAR